jgi:hypothetical protein
MNMSNNPFARKTQNLTEQMRITKSDPALAERLRAEAAELDAEERRQAHTRSLDEFNAMDKDAKIKFIENGGEVR